MFPKQLFGLTLVLACTCHHVLAGPVASDIDALVSFFVPFTIAVSCHYFLAPDQTDV